MSFVIFLALCVLPSFSVRIFRGKRISQEHSTDLEAMGNGDNVALHTKSLDLQNATSALSSMVRNRIRRQAIGKRKYFGGPLPKSICQKPHTVDGTYQVDKEIGQGGYGTVFRATDWNTKETKALKKVKYEKCTFSDQKNCSKLKSLDPMELQPMRLKLPFVADLDNVFHEGEYVWIDTRFYEGGDLWAWIEDKGTKAFGSLEEIRNLGAQIAFGIWQLQKSGFLHSDMKPDNVFLVDAELNRAVVGDFGFSSRCGPFACHKGRVGTPHYMAPNIVRNVRHGFEVDWWAFGVTLLDMVDPDNPPYLGNHNKETWNNIKSGKPNWSPRSLERPFKPLRRFLEKFITLKEYRFLANDNARQKMMSADPADHPILSDSFWIDMDPASYETQRSKDSYRQEINKYWMEICKQYSLQNCDGMSSTHYPYQQPLCSLDSPTGPMPRLRRPPNPPPNYRPQLPPSTTTTTTTATTTTTTTTITTTTTTTTSLPLPACTSKCDFVKLEVYPTKEKAQGKFDSVCRQVKEWKICKTKECKDPKTTSKQCKERFSGGWGTHKTRQKCCKCLLSPECADADCVKRLCEKPYHSVRIQH